MNFREFHYRWEHDLTATPEHLWPLVANTNRFNRDTGVPAIEELSEPETKFGIARRRLRLTFIGMPVEWEEQPFEWVRPQRFGVIRHYSKGPIAEMRVLVELAPSANGGTHLVYQLWARPSSLIGLVAIPIQIGFLTRRKFAETFARYDRMAASTDDSVSAPVGIEFAPGGLERFESLTKRLRVEASSPEIVDRLANLIAVGDELTLSRIRPFAMADAWKLSRTEVLGLFLFATRAGLLDLQWELICPHCRGAAETTNSLSGVRSNVACEGCKIDFDVNFDRSVELTFRPNPSIRPVEVRQFCVGSPEVTPHIVAQQILSAGESRELSLPLEEGRYRVRTGMMSGGQSVRVVADGSCAVTFRASSVGWPDTEMTLSESPTLCFENATEAQQLFVLERMTWSDQAATAAEVTALQVFRDLFANEALRPGEQISVGSLTVLFTDLRGSTQMYREIGDAPAFGRVMSHFDVLKGSIAAEDGALVKTIGDAVMAVFRRPASAVRAFLDAQAKLAEPADSALPLKLKGGIHSGHCIAVTLNERLDYFGSTINMAARLEGLSTGEDVVISDFVRVDPEVSRMLSEDLFGVAPFEMRLKGFDDENFTLWRVTDPRQRLAPIPSRV